MIKWLLILPIKLYWKIIPPAQRRTCLFRISCSRHVYQVTQEKGLYQGLKALRYRFLNCRHGELFNHPVTGCQMMILPNQEVLTTEEISIHLLKPPV